MHNSNLVGILIRKDKDMQDYHSALLAEMRDGDRFIEVDSSMSEREVEHALKDVSGICVTGYSDPEWLDEFMIGYAMENSKALLAICQGIQDMAIYTRDDVEPVVSHMMLDRRHEYVHWVNISKNSNLYNILKCDRIPVNSCHNNMVLWNQSWDIVGVSDDGVVEAMENSEHPFQIGVQWHLEMLMDEYAKKLFAEFVRVCYSLER